MNTWTPDALRRIGDARDLYVATPRRDGTLRSPVQIWHVRVDDAIYIRSAHGPDNGWFRRAKNAGAGRIQSGGVEQDVSFEPAPPERADEITAAYHAKYDRYGPTFVAAVTGDDVQETTLRVMPKT